MARHVQVVLEILWACKIGVVRRLQPGSHQHKSDQGESEQHDESELQQVLARIPQALSERAAAPRLREDLAAHRRTHWSKPSARTTCREGPACFASSRFIAGMIASRSRATARGAWIVSSTMPTAFGDVTNRHPRIPLGLRALLGPQVLRAPVV